MRIIIYGAGGIGGTIGARLQMTGTAVTLIARGRHLAALARDGLRFLTPSGAHQLQIPVVAHPSELTFAADDVVFLCMKSQHTEPALRDLRAAAGVDVPVVCVQNGVANERAAARYFRRVYGMVVMLPAVHLEAGVVVTHATGVGGILDVGCFPAGTDDLARDIAAALATAGFSAKPDAKVMRWKYAKLLLNLNNALQAAVGLQTDARAVAGMLRAEALACYAAAGIDCASAAENKARRADGPHLAEVEGVPRGGGSSWQSLARGTGDIESDYLNGEIALLGRLHGIATPANDTLQLIADELGRTRARPGTVTVAEVMARIADAEQRNGRSVENRSHANS
jgi:2-dehydropantoate 2-reductase